jgi:hypothetical protein
MPQAGSFRALNARKRQQIQSKSPQNVGERGAVLQEKIHKIFLVRPP